MNTSPFLDVRARPIPLRERIGAMATVRLTRQESFGSSFIGAAASSIVHAMATGAETWCWCGYAACLTGSWVAMAVLRLWLAGRIRWAE